MNTNKHIATRSLIAISALLMFGFAIVGKAFLIQFQPPIVKANHPDGRLDYTYKTLRGKRGNIYSSDGRLLATSIKYYKLVLDLKQEQLRQVDFDLYIDTLSSLFATHFPAKSKREYKEALHYLRHDPKAPRGSVFLKDLTVEDKIKISDWPMFSRKIKDPRTKQKSSYAQLQFIEEDKRWMPYDLLANRTIGRVSHDEQLNTFKYIGLEGRYNEYLEGDATYQLMRKIDKDLFIPADDGGKIYLENGQDIVSTIDVNFQDITETALLEALQRYDASYGSAVVMEVKTGFVRAIANIGKNTEGIYTENLNYALVDAGEPGSSVKIAALLALLEDDYVNLEDSVDVESGRVKIGGRWLTDADSTIRGKITVQRSVEISSNIAIAKLMKQYYESNPRRYLSYLEQFGLTDTTGIDIIGEVRPYIKKVNDTSWNHNTVAWMGMGYEWKLTPIQILKFYNAIANDGVALKPRLVQEIRSLGKTTKTFAPEPTGKTIAGRGSLKKIRQVLEGVVQRGTGASRKSEHLSFAGKTGTSRIAESSKGYTMGDYRTSFVGYFPADQPVYSCIVTIVKPRRNGFTGGTTALPVFKVIMERLYAKELKLLQAANLAQHESVQIPLQSTLPGFTEDMMRIAKSMGWKLSNIDDKPIWTKLSSTENGLTLTPKTVIPNLVPDVHGMGLRDALFLMESSGLRVQVKGKGKVFRQSLPPGIRIIRGSHVFIELG